MKKLIKIELLGEKIGTIWYPPVECTKEFHERFTPDDKPFSREWNGLDDALQFICNDGDFQNCEINDLWGYAYYQVDRGILETPLKFNYESKLLKEFLYHE